MIEFYSNGILARLAAAMIADQANHFKTPSFGLNVYVGHYFNRYLAAQVSLMRPVEWAYAYGIQNPNDWP